MPEIVDSFSSIYGNQISEKTYKKATASKARYAKKYGDDHDSIYHLAAVDLPVIGERLGVRGLTSCDVPLDIEKDAASSKKPPQTSRTVEGANGSAVVVGNIRMGFGHYRIAMAMASAAHAMGYTPYWLDLTAFPQTTGSKVISHQNDLYSMGSRLSQRFGLFNKLYWEPLNSEGFRQLSYNATDQKNSELMTPILRDLPRDVPYIGTHVWPAQAAVHAGLTHVVNAIPDNWPMALHLAEGAIHTVQTPSSYLGYQQLRGMAKGQTLSPMPVGSLVYTGHYVDHELVENIEDDCRRRRARVEGAGPVRYLLTVGGAGAQAKLFRGIIEHLVPLVERGQAVLFVNVGDHRGVWDELKGSIPALGSSLTSQHFDDFSRAADFATDALTGTVEGIHAFCDSDIFAAVYITNLLMRACDVLVTKPSELAFYPVPKLMIQRVGGHEAWGAIRAAEMGDGTYELSTLAEVRAMIDAFQNLRDPLVQMCRHIVANKRAGIYDGAYRVVRLANGATTAEINEEW